MRRVPRALSVSFSLGIAALLCACTVGPKYKRPDAPVAARWDVAEPWRESAPSDSLPKGQWWAVFSDDDLNNLEQQALTANESIKAASAHLEQARALAAIQVAYVFPQFSTAPSAERQRLSGNRPTNGVPTTLSAATQNNFTLPFTVSYEADLFGGRRRSIESAQANYQASAADLENVRLMITSELAGDYFSLRQLDAQYAILDHTVSTLTEGLKLVDARHKGGVASGLDVAQEETLLHSTRTQAILIQQQRKQFEDAIAVLTNHPAPDFHLSPKPYDAEPPAINAGLPSDLLERRPDIAEAEREMAAANAQIGVARAAYFPSLNLFGSGGWQAANIAKLANVQSTFWAVGANVAETIFSGGARRAQVQYAQSGYDAAVANYRGSVLNALREVQDALTGLAVLSDAQKSQQEAVDSARRTVDIANNRYVGGLVSYLDVVNAQQTLLNDENQMAVIRGQKLVNSVLLVKALGGGWDSASLNALQVKPKLSDVVAP
ncbi:MAG TPA: efflux transporter outer membrane subunit [Blastocatellia bacterium]|nr:efflux transporter outer membrane subunit [Blastocatellia bacterium]